LSIATGIFFVLGLFWFYKGLFLFESSRIIPAIGGMVPIFTSLLIYLFSGGKEILNLRELIAFVLLVFGSILIVYERKKGILFKGFYISVISAFLLAIYFVAMKYVFLAQPFWAGLMWIRIGAFLTAVLFLFFKEVRKDVFKKKEGGKVSFKTAVIFILNQAIGAGGNLLQSWAIALSPLVYVAFINALQGIQYVFLLIMTVMLSFWFPMFLREQISKKGILQKIIAIIIIGGGLVLLSL
jgi:hypothetical protein